MATPATVEARARVGSIRVVLRGYYSGHLLLTAQHEAELAGQIETALAGGESRFSIEHRGYVLSSIIASVAFLEAMVNELYQDAADGHASYVAPLSAECRHLMAEFWRSTKTGERLGAIEKYEMLFAFAGAPALDRGRRVYEDAKLAIAVRNTLVHFRPEDRSSEDEAHAMEKRLRRKFLDNALMAGSGNPWWPDHALGYGAAVWAQSVRQGARRPRLGGDRDRAELPEARGRRVGASARSAKARRNRAQGVRESEMKQYRWIAAERSTKDGVDYWRLMFDVVGGGEGDVILASDPLPEPFDAFDRERFYTEEELDLLRGNAARGR